MNTTGEDRILRLFKRAAHQETSKLLSKHIINMKVINDRFQAKLKDVPKSK